jgi:hypothetical protein
MLARSIIFNAPALTPLYYPPSLATGAVLITAFKCSEIKNMAIMTFLKGQKHKKRPRSAPLFTPYVLGGKIIEFSAQG